MPRGRHASAPRLPRPPRRGLPVLFAAGLAAGLTVAAVVPQGGGAGDANAAGRPARASAAAAVVGPRVADCSPAPLRRRAGQVLLVGLPGVTTADDPLARDVLAADVGGVFIGDSNVTEATGVRALVDGLQEASRIPLLVATDEESGRVSTFRGLLGATSSPRTLAATRSSGEVRDSAAQLAVGLAGLGITMNLAPVADLDAGDAAGVIGDRSFSADPRVAGQYALAFARGLADGGVIPVVKHFPGHGRAGGDVHRKPSVVDVPAEVLADTDLRPFVAAIEAGVPAIMTGHVSYTTLDPQLPASLSPATYELLRELGFTGVAVTDSLGMGAVHGRWGFAEAAVMAVDAGADLVLATDGREAQAMRRALVRAVRDGRLEEGRLNEAAARVLALKGVEPEPLTCVHAEVPRLR